MGKPLVESWNVGCFFQARSRDVNAWCCCASRYNVHSPQIIVDMTVVSPDVVAYAEAEQVAIVMVVDVLPWQLLVGVGSVDAGSENAHQQIQVDNHSEHAPWMLQTAVDDTQQVRTHGGCVAQVDMLHSSGRFRV